jgi:6-phosphogluconolactonase
VASPGADLILSHAPDLEAARRLVAALVEADRANGSARLAIAGGSAVRALRAAREELPAGVWSRVRLTWVDERCVPFGSADSNRGEAHRSGALFEGAPPAVELPLFFDGETVVQSLSRARAALHEVFGGALDVTLLGMGPDGHIASLFPGQDALTHEHEGALVLHVADSPKPPPSRLTLTRSLLATAKTHVLLAVGEGKREALERLISGDPALPAAGLSGLVVVTDVDLGSSSNQGKRT